MYNVIADTNVVRDSFNALYGLFARAYNAYTPGVLVHYVFLD